MANLTIGDHTVKVDDSFMQLSPEEQQATVEEIAASLGIGAAAKEVGVGEDVVKSGASGAIRGAAESGQLMGDVATFIRGLPEDALAAAPRFWSKMLPPAAQLVPGLGEALTTPVPRKDTVFAGLGRAMEATGLMRRPEDVDTRTYRQIASDVTGGFSEYQPQTTAGEYAGTVGEFAGASAVMPIGGGGVFSGIPTRVAGSVIPGLGSEAAGQLAEVAGLEGTGYETAARVIGGLAGGVLGGTLQNLPNRLREAKAKRAMIESAPEIEALKAQSDELYAAATSQGVTASAAQVDDFADDIMATLKSEGIVSPKGGINESYPKVRSFVRMLDDYRDSSMTPTQMMQLKKELTRISQAKGSEGYFGSLMTERFYAFVDPLAPQIREANSVYRTLSQGRLIERAIERARSKAGKYSASGFENALRDQFRNLELRIIDGKVRMSPDEVAMVRRIARGGTWENIARDLGKYAPKGPISSVLVGGLPYYIGQSIGGPLLGGVMAGAALGAGALGRSAATSLQQRNVDLLSALVRSGGKLPANAALPRPGTATTAIPGLLTIGD